MARRQSRDENSRLKNQSPSLDDLISRRSVEATDLTSDSSLLSPLSPLNLNDPLSEIENLNQYNPEGRDRPRQYFSGYSVRDRRPSARQSSKGFRVRSQTNAHLVFAEPKNVVLCVRRKSRREVLFAKRKTRSAGRRPRRRNWTTYIGC